MRILIDLDGVCVDFYGQLIRRYNFDYDDNLNINEVTSWHIDHKVFRKATREHLRKIYFSDPEFWSGMAPIEGCQESLLRLKKQGMN